MLGYMLYYPTAIAPGLMQHQNVLNNISMLLNGLDVSSYTRHYERKQRNINTQKPIHGYVACAERRYVFT